MTSLKDTPKARLKNLAEKPKKESITAGYDSNELEKFNSRLIPGLLIEMKVYCARNKVKIQDFINEAILEKMNTGKK